MVSASILSYSACVPMNRIKIHCFSKLNFTTSLYAFPLMLKTTRLSFSIEALAYLLLLLKIRRGTHPPQRLHGSILEICTLHSQVSFCNFHFFMPLSLKQSKTKCQYPNTTYEHERNNQSLPYTSKSTGDTHTQTYSTKR